MVCVCVRVCVCVCAWETKRERKRKRCKKKPNVCLTLFGLVGSHRCSTEGVEPNDLNHVVRPIPSALPLYWGEVGWV